MSRPLRIGMVCFPHLGGSGIVATELAAALSERGHEVHVVASGPLSRRLPASDRLVLHEVPMPGHPALQYPPYGLALASSLVSIARAHRLDIVHVHYAVPHASSAQLARQIVGAGAPRVVTTLHGSDVTQIGSDPAYLETTRFAVERSDGVTVPSAYLKEQAFLRLGLPGGREIDVIPNFVDTARFAPPPARDRARFDALFDGATGDRGAPVLFHVSSFRPVKRVADLVEVLARLRQRIKARLVVVGDGPERASFLARVREAGLQASVHLSGTHAEFVDDLKHADAFLFPSESESFGVAALEALSCGVPVVAYRVGGLPEVVTPEVGRLVTPFDTEAFAAAAHEIVTDAGLRETLGRAARARAESSFRRETAVLRYEDHYRRVLDAAPGEDR